MLRRTFFTTQMADVGVICKVPDLRTLALLTAALLCALAPLDVSHLLAGLLGAAGYLLLQALEPVLAAGRAVPKGATGKAPRALQRPPPRRQQPPSPPPAREAWKPSVVPVTAPVFRASGFEAEVNELLGRLAPSAADDAAVADIVRAVRGAVLPLFPQAEVEGFASVGLRSGAAFAVAVPDVDVVVSVSPDAIARRLPARGGGQTGADAVRLQKAAIRMCTDRLVGFAGFKFRRSAFRGAEPKVTLLALAAAGARARGEHGVPFDLSVNAATPLYAAALLAECGRMDPRARALILLVRRWAKDRGVSHAAKGHLSPYAWTVLAIYFLQVGLPHLGPLLPPLAAFAASSALLRGRRAAAAPPAPVEADAPAPRDAACREPTGGREAAGAEDVSAAALLRAFVGFYAREFDWRAEAVSLHLGRRAPPGVAVPLHIVESEDGLKTQVGPSIEDPFEDAHNLASVMTAETLSRLHEEFRRADSLCRCAGASLTVLLEPWTPAPNSSDAAEEARGGS